MPAELGLVPKVWDWTAPVPPMNGCGISSEYEGYRYFDRFDTFHCERNDHPCRP